MAGSQRHPDTGREKKNYHGLTWDMMSENDANANETRKGLSKEQALGRRRKISCILSFFTLTGKSSTLNKLRMR